VTSALDFFQRDVLYKSTFYLLTCVLRWGTWTMERCHLWAVLASDFSGYLLSRVVG